MSESSTLRDRQIAFLMLHPSRSDLPKSPRNGLWNIGAQSLFFALSLKDSEILAAPNIGKGGLQTIRNFFAEKGLKLGQTRDFIENNKEFFTYYNSERKITMGKKPVDDPVNDEEVSKSDYIQKLGEFLDSSGLGQNWDPLRTYPVPEQGSAATSQFSKAAPGNAASEIKSESILPPVGNAPGIDRT